MPLDHFSRQRCNVYCDADVMQGRLVAMDIHKGRLGALKTAAAAQGLADVISTRTGDLCQYADWAAALPQEQQQEHRYDRVLVDAPCSGLGVLAKRQAKHLFSSACFHEAEGKRSSTFGHAL